MGFARSQVAVIDRDVAAGIAAVGSNLEVEPKMKWRAVGREMLGDEAIGLG